MSEAQKPFLYTRSDGYTETPGGDYAIVMLTRTACNNDICWFQYRPGFNAAAIRVEWNKDDTLVLLPSDIVGGLLAARYARLPTTAEVQAFIDGPLPEQIVADTEVQTPAEPAKEPVTATPQAAPQATENPAPVPTPTPAPENAPVVPPAGETGTVQLTTPTPPADAPAVLASPDKPAAELANQTPPPVAEVPQVPKTPVVTAPPAKKK